MTFGAYLSNLGVILAQWLPVAGLFYAAIRLAIRHEHKRLAALAFQKAERERQR